MLIAISAKRGHGKNQYRQFLKQRLIQKGKKVHDCAFADLLKVFSDNVYQKLKHLFKDQYLFDKIDNSIKENPNGMILARSWWTSVGTEVKKSFGHLAWVQALINQQFEKQYFYYPQFKDNYCIITDLRFKNQLQFLRSHKFNDKIKLLRIWRNGQHPTAGFVGTTQQFLNDKSQIDLDSVKNWDKFIYNNDSLQNLKQDAYNYVDKIISE